MKNPFDNRIILSRENTLKNFVLMLFLGMSSYPKLLLEVFIRRNFGIRYFNLGSALTVLLLALTIPVWVTQLSEFGIGHAGNFWIKYTSLYAFLIAFCYQCYKRKREQKFAPSPYSLERVSYYSGDIDNRFRTREIFGIDTTQRNIEIFYEPGLFLAIGIVLAVLGQALGYLLVFCAIVYSVSYYTSYKMADGMILSKIDEMIQNQEMEAMFVDEKSPLQTRGANIPGRKPESRENREALLKYFQDKEADMAVAS